MSDDVASPCIDLCIIDDGVCTGCGMTSQEVNTWHKMDNDDRRKVVERLALANVADE